MIKNRAFNSNDDDLLLRYDSTSTPSPIQVGESAAIEITVGVGDSAESIYCREITFLVPIGTDPDSFFINDPKPTVSVEGDDWIPQGANFKPERYSANERDFTNFTFINRTDSPILSNETIVFKLSGKINRMPGISEVKIFEMSGTESDDRSDKSGVLKLPKNKAEFYLRNFMARSLSESLLPVTEFGNGQGIMLSWESNGTNFKIYEKNNPKPIYNNSQTSFMFEGISRDTTFFLEAIKTRDADRMLSPKIGDSPLLAADAPEVLYETLTITVTNADLTPKSVDVKNATRTGTLNVSGQTEMSGRLNVADNAKLASTFADSLSVSGHSELTDAKLRGALTVEGKTTLVGTDLNGTLSVKGIANVWSGNNFASREGFMMPGSLTVGSIEKSFGGGSGWNGNTAGLMLETADNTEIAIHDSATRLASFMYYEGGSNRITIGRDMGWGALGTLAVGGSVGIKTGSPRAALEVGDSSTNTLKAILGCLPEGNDQGTYLAVKGYDTQPTNAKSFALEHYFYGRLNSAINFYRGGGMTGGRIGFSTNDGTEKMTIEDSGRVGIGTTSPSVPLEVRGFSDYDLGGGFWFAEVKAQRNAMGGSHINSISIKAAAGIQTELAFFVTSDARIKKDLRESDAKNDLETLTKLEVTDYRYVDNVRHGDQSKKGFIAQQVESVFPQAVGRQTAVLPDIYRQATVKNGWVELATDLKEGMRVKLISPNGTESIYEVSEAESGKFLPSPPVADGEIFVYGREVCDFRFLDYDAVAVLNVSATQQIKREKDAEINALRQLNEDLENAFRLLTVRVRSLENKAELPPMKDAGVLV